MSTSNDDPFRSPVDRAAAAEQHAAIEHMRAKQQANKGPVVFFPFGKQQPLEKYVGMKMVPFSRNPYVGKPEMLIKQPEPGYRYGWAKNDDPRIRGLLRAGVYEPVYLDELRDDNDGEIYVEDVLTESGATRKKVLWLGHMLFKISARAYFDRVEVPALSSSVRLMQHKAAFEDFSMQSVARADTVENGVRVSQVVSGGDFRDMRGKAEVSMTIE